MVKNKTRQKPVNAWVSLCLVTKRLANWGELLSVGSEVQVLFGTPANNAESLCFQGLSAFFNKFLCDCGDEIMFSNFTSNSDF